MLCFRETQSAPMNMTYGRLSPWVFILPGVIPMSVTVIVLLFLLGLVLIVKGGDFFVDAAAWMAEVSGIPKVIIGATVVSLATTLPELLVSLLAATQGKADMAVGNAVGSVTANLGLILSLCALFLPFAFRRKEYAAKALLMIAAVGVLYACSLEGFLSTLGVLLLFLICALFFYENIRSAKRQILPAHNRPSPTKNQVTANLFKFAFGTLGIIIGARLLVDQGSALAALLGVPEGIISVTVIAIGTSLPELVTTVASILKKQGSLSVGNILGANIIDTTLIVPLCGMIARNPLAISPQSLTLDLPICLAMCLVFTAPMLCKGKLMRWQGVAALTLYGVYLGLLVF